MTSGMARRKLLGWLAAAAILAGPLAAGVLHAAPEAGKPVDINRASAEELQQLPGVGPALAKRIVEYREKNGPFGSVDDLLKVRGIGEKSLEKIRDLVTVGGGKKRS